MQIAKQYVKPLARIGYASRGVIYAIIGFFALLAALGEKSGDKKDAKGALETLLGQPFGDIMVFMLIAGLAGYIMWRLIQAIFDTDSHGYSLKGLAVRGGLLASAATYTTIAVFALSLMGLIGSGQGDSNSSSLADTIAGFVGAKTTALVLALVFAGVAISHWYKAFTRRYADHIEADEDKMKFIHPISIIGLSARGLIFAIISVLLFLRFDTAGGSDAAEKPGMKDVMNFLHGLPYGSVLLAAVAVGLLLFAAYSFCEAIWRRINYEDA